MAEKKKLPRRFAAKIAEAQMGAKLRFGRRRTNPIVSVHRRVRGSVRRFMSSDLYGTYEYRFEEMVTINHLAPK